MSFIPKRAARRVMVRVTPSGAWIVSDERERRGGRFRDRETALRFIHREFGLEAQLVMCSPVFRQAA